MTTATKKPKARAWRGVLYPSFMGSDQWVGLPTDEDRTNCTVIPDGADMPLPRSVRRVMRAVEALNKLPMIGASGPLSLICKQIELREELRNAMDAHLSPRKRKS